MRQRFSMKTICGTRQDSPLVTEKGAVARAPARACGKIRNDHDIEFQSLRLVHGQKTHDVIILRHDLSFGLAHRWIIGTLAKVSNDLVQSRRTLPRKLTGDFDQL